MQLHITVCKSPQAFSCFTCYLLLHSCNVGFSSAAITWADYSNHFNSIIVLLQHQLISRAKQTSLPLICSQLICYNITNIWTVHTVFMFTYNAVLQGILLLYPGFFEWIMGTTFGSLNMQLLYATSELSLGWKLKNDEWSLQFGWMWGTFAKTLP